MKRTVMLAMGLGIAVSMLVPGNILAETTEAFGAKDFLEQSKTIQDFLFGPGMRMVGVFAGAYGFFQAILSSNIRPLLTFGAIGLAFTVIPKFIDGIFSASGMLISQM